jgi:hypothetical protein
MDNAQHRDGAHHSFPVLPVLTSRMPQRIAEAAIPHDACSKEGSFVSSMRARRFLSGSKQSFMIQLQRFSSCRRQTEGAAAMFWRQFYVPPPRIKNCLHGADPDIRIANRSFENVSQFKYLGTTVTNENLIQEELRAD